ncbi:hypothetical protein SORDD17_00168 [Streptococcus oralis]|uniref:Glycosyl transferase family 1 domain-containing protein n=2 Tax=Streptococcus oralis TaxID=1303 RepID=A0A139RPF5_STROR|nr:hypothetical protein SORDD17_00168 [Streptococcus oralis]
MCALEAMSRGLPIVSTPTDGLVDLIEQDKTGFYSDDDHLLATSIVDYLSDPIRYQELTENTKQRFAQIMDVESYQQTLDALYKK